jgi:hypothetical protein
LSAAPKDQFAPRLGATWQITRKTVLRVEKAGRLSGGWTR